MALPQGQTQTHRVKAESQYKPSHFIRALGDSSTNGVEQLDTTEKYSGVASTSHHIPSQLRVDLKTYTNEIKLQRSLLFYTWEWLSRHNPQITTKDKLGFIKISPRTQNKRQSLE